MLVCNRRQFKIFLSFVMEMVDLCLLLYATECDHLFIDQYRRKIENKYAFSYADNELIENFGLNQNYNVFNSSRMTTNNGPKIDKNSKPCAQYVIVIVYS